MTFQKRFPLFPFFALILAALACALPGAQQPTQGPTPVAITVAALPTQTQPLPATEVPTLPPTSVPPTPVPTTSGRMATFDNILFVVPEGLSQSELSEIVDPVTNGSPWDVTVQHVKFTLTGYSLSGTSWQPVIYVFPIAGYDQAADTIANLKQLLSLRPADANDMPFLPLVNAGQEFRSKVAYMDFASGSGVRFVSQYGQGPWPINNKDTFYTFQGLTSDGKYYVSVIMPVSNSVLPATGDGADMSKVGDNSYVAGVRDQLNAQPDESFVPSLAVLDALAKSITVR